MTALENNGVSYGRPARRTIRIVDGVVGMLASEQQIWSEEVRCPGCIDRIEVIIYRKRVHVRVYPFVVRRRWCGNGRSIGCCENHYEDGGFRDARCRGLIVGPVSRAHCTTDEVHNL